MEQTYFDKGKELMNSNNINYKKAKKYLLKSMEEKEGLTEGEKIELYLMMMNIFAVEKKYEEIFEYGELILKLNASPKNKVYAYSKYAHAYYDKNDIVNAEKYYDMCLELYENNLTEIEKKELFGHHVSHIYTKGQILYEKRDYESAIKYFNQVLKIASPIDDLYYITHSHVGLFYIYDLLRDYEKAKSHLIYALQNKQDIGKDLLNNLNQMKKQRYSTV